MINFERKENYTALRGFYLAVCFSNNVLETQILFLLKSYALIQKVVLQNDAICTCCVCVTGKYAPFPHNCYRINTRRQNGGRFECCRFDTQQFQLFSMSAAVISYRGSAYLTASVRKRGKNDLFFIVQAVVLKMYTFGSSNGIHKFEFTCLNCSAYKFLSNKRFYLDTSGRGTF